MKPAVQLEAVRKRYRDGDASVRAIDDVSLTIQAGALVALEGPSGSGKSTLLGLMGAMIAPTRGRALLFGQDVTHLRDHHRTAIRRETVGFAFQSLGLIEGMTVRENLLLPWVPLGGADQRARERAEAALKRFGVGDRIDSRVERLSGGQRQRCAIARALVMDPPLVLLDEPTAHLDTDNALEVIARLAELTASGTTVVVATHDPRLAHHAAVERTVALEDGAVRADSASRAPGAREEEE